MNTIGQHEFLSAYLQYTENTESPKICHIWAAISAVSACLGRRCWFTNGMQKVWPNLYVVFSGPPGARKSAAILCAKDLIKDVTNIRFAPDDTGGQRQGLISAMTDLGPEEDENFNIAEIMAQLDKHQQTITGMSMNGHKHPALEALDKIRFDTRDPRTMYIMASELKSFLGENNAQMLTFLQKMWDGEEYTYKLRRTEDVMKDGLLGIIGATTPSELATMLPPGSMGSGFTSRVIFVYSPSASEKKWRASLDVGCEKFLRDRFELIFYKWTGEFKMTAAAEKVDHDIYMYRSHDLKDPRLSHYLQRRQTHLHKVSMSIAAARGQMVVDKIDISLADELLLITEAEMAEALGEFGINKETIAKQKLLEFLRACDFPTPMTTLRAYMMRDFTRVVDFENALAEFVSANKVRFINVAELGQCVIAISENTARRAKQQMSTIQNLLKRNKE